MSWTTRSRAARLILAGAVATAITSTAVSPWTAQAAEVTVDDVTLTWGLSIETGGGAYFGGCNFLVAGESGDAGGSSPWSPAQAETLYKAVDGNVSIIKDAQGGGTEAPTWATKCLSAAGTAVNTSAASTTNNKAVFSNGSGTVDLDAGTASVSWDGAVTVVFYGGMTYWSAVDPVLTVHADGTGTLTATGTGYGAAMDDPTLWEPLTPTPITLATLSGVELTESGVTVTPDYEGVEVTTSPTVMGQVRTNPGWGSFPQDFIDFHERTGQSSYWYSSGGAADPKKPATALTLDWEVSGSEEPPADGESTDVDVEVTVPETDVEPQPGVLELSVTGTANLGQATALGAGFTASGALPEVTVSDSRDAGSWSVNGRLGAFSSSAGGTIPAAALGWAPTAVSGVVQLGAAVAPNAPGLGTSATLAQGAAGVHAVSADLQLIAPAGTQAGDYSAKLTLTVVG